MGIFKRISNYWLCQIIGWSLAGLSILFFAYTFSKKISLSSYLRIVVVVLGGILITHLLRWVIKKSNWLSLSLANILPRLILALVLASLSYGFLVVAVQEYLDLYEVPTKHDFIFRLLATAITLGLYTSTWTLIYYFYHFFKKSRKEELDNLRLESMVKELEIRSIKSQLNPDFIFNALNSIRGLVDENPVRARNAVTELSNILRNSMLAEKSETALFKNELSVVKDYLALECMRFEDRLKIEFKIDEQTLDRPIPTMLLQKLVENAIKHGVSKQLNGGVVMVISDFKGQYHELIVQNSGSLNGNINKDGIILLSIKNRLTLLFGEKANFEMQQKGPLVEARVLIPVEIGFL